MKTLALEIRFVDGRLNTTLPDGTGRTETGEIDLEFDTQTGLPAVLKALNALTYNPDDFHATEREFLQQRKMLSDSEPNPRFAPDLRKIVGARLFKMLFPTEPMRRVLENAYRSPGAIHYSLTFNAEATTVGDLPWELLYHDNDFLIGGGRGSLSRHLAYGRVEYPRPTLSLQELNVLLIMPRPPGLQTLDRADAEALAAVEGVHIERLAAETSDAFTDYMRTHSGDAAPHVIHFDGHGAYGKRCWTCRHVSPMRAETCTNSECTRSALDAQPQGFLAWEHPRFGLEMVSATAFANQIGFVSRGERSSLRLIVVSACRSGSSTGGSAFSGIAQRLIKASVPAVVAMQFEVRADTATAFADSLYRSIVRDDSLSDAVAEARTMIDGLEDDQWYRPVLYFAATPEVSEGRLFQLGQERTAVDPNASDRTLVEQARQALVRAHDLAPAQPDLNRSVGDAREDFERVVRKLELMNDYKKIHDELHEVYIGAYMSMRENAASFDEDATVRATFVDYERDARKHFTTLRGLAHDSVDRVDASAVAWINDLADIDAMLLSGIHDNNGQLVNKAVRDLDNIVSLRPSQLNGLLVQAEKDLRLGSVIAVLRVTAADSVISAGADALDVLRARLDALVSQHDEWQYFEPYLRQLDPKENLGWFVEDWPGRRKGLEKLCGNRTDSEVSALREAWAAVDTAVADLGEPPWPTDDEQRKKERAVRESFAACAFQASMRFYEVDKALKAICEALIPLAGPISDLKSKDRVAA
jgi:CHAT domain-containing protein